ncbi:hypothetical protein DY000_02018065 [Brassica cretica]|uniref:RING-type domain-containing protein n=1 Tax=Brassica cretica TaxID=69181 RepID=A0ABQ7CXS9_BRACR|nr:hypothetical protein DY000_02018065 [Brassica cretica]
MKDNLMLKTEGQLQDDYMTLMGRRAMYPLCKAKSSKEKESCVICFDEDIDSDLMFSVDTCRHRFCVNCVKQHLTVKLLDGTIPNCLHHGCTTQLSVDTCGQCRAYTFGDLRCGYNFCYDCGVGMNSPFIHSCRISRDDHVPQPRIMSETDATTAALQAILNASINFLFIIFFCFIMYKVLG